MAYSNTRKFFEIDDRLLDLAAKTEEDIRPAFTRIENNAFVNQQKVLAAFISNGVGRAASRHLRATATATSAGISWNEFSPTRWNARTRFSGTISCAAHTL